MTTPIYITDTVPLYSCFIIGDPSADAPDARNDATLIAAQQSVLAASRYKAYLRTSPDPPTVRLVLQLPPADTAAPAGPWQDHRTADIDCPQGQLRVENISAGALTFRPGPANRFTPADGPGRSRITVWFRGRHHPRADAGPSADAPAADPSLIIPEEYLIRLAQRDLAVSTRPAVPQYYRATPADLTLYFRNPVSSMISTPSGSSRCSTT